LEQLKDVYTIHYSQIQNDWEEEKIKTNFFY
jgi:hypothetical protein